MTCRELRQYLEDTLRQDAVFGVGAEHLAQCAECTQFIAARRELDAGLALLRDAVARPSAALDAAVLANYRRHIESQRPGTRSIATWARLLVASGGLAATLLVAVLVVLQYQRRTDAFIVALPSRQAQPSLAQSVMPSKSTSFVDLHEATHANSPRNQKPSRSPRSLTNAAPPMITGPASPEFRSLMYCDELSCGGAMQLIRVQLPLSITQFALNRASPAGFVYADVLVGPDGIARGIRVPE